MARVPHRVILIVDDDQRIRNFVIRVLRPAGCDVIEAKGGLEAMAAIVSSPAQIALAIIDLDMPGIGGLDFANQLAMDRPGTPLLYTSHNIRSVAVQSISLKSPLSVLQKPFTAEDLIARVRPMISAKRKRKLGVEAS